MGVGGGESEKVNALPFQYCFKSQVVWLIECDEEGNPSERRIRVLVEKIVPPAKTNAGILLPKKTSKLNYGRVIAVGPGLLNKEGNPIPVSVKEGDTVLLPEYGGTQIKLEEKEYHLYRDEDILGTLHD